jgi:hypothetical protein
MALQVASIFLVLEFLLTAERKVVWAPGKKLQPYARVPDVKNMPSIKNSEPASTYWPEANPEAHTLRVMRLERAAQQASRALLEHRPDKLSYQLRAIGKALQVCFSVDNVQTAIAIFAHLEREAAVRGDAYQETLRCFLTDHRTSLAMLYLQKRMPQAVQEGFCRLCESVDWPCAKAAPLERRQSGEGGAASAVERIDLPPSYQRPNAAKPPLYPRKKVVPASEHMAYRLGSIDGSAVVHATCSKQHIALAGWDIYCRQAVCPEASIEKIAALRVAVSCARPDRELLRAARLLSPPNTNVPDEVLLSAAVDLFAQRFIDSVASEVTVSPVVISAR